MSRVLVAILLSVAMASPALAQSQAINGTIEGTVVDDQGGVLPGVTVTVANLDTGESRALVTNDTGAYRAPLLSLGRYRVVAELSGFKKLEQSGIQLSAGQTAVVNVQLGVGDISEVISVTADTPVVDLGKIDQGRTLNEREIKELPLTSRNPYNFALLEPGVTGFENQEFGVPRLTANGAIVRVNYQIDGNDNTQKDRAGLRQMPMSEVMIREVKVVTTGYAPEFGQTMGLVYNAITPSGTNVFHGDGSYRLQRKPMVALPFFAPTKVKPPTVVNVFTLANGGPIAKDRAWYYGGFENTRRDLSGGRVITIPAASQQQLGLSEPGYMPSGLNTKFGIGKLDQQLAPNHRLSVRYIYFKNFITNNIGGGPVSVQRGTDFTDRQNSTAGQLVSTLGSRVLNELRMQYATRRQSRAPGSQAGTGPAILVSAGNIQFGGPIAGGQDSGFGFTENIAQVIENLTLLAGNHGVKVGVSGQFVKDTRTQTSYQLYTFPDIPSYLAARSGTARLGYTNLQQFFGDPNLEYRTRMYAAFAQDDWRVSPNVKVLFGVRYDLYAPPDADPGAPIESSRSFHTDRNNLQPRGGFVWTPGDSRRTVIRGNTGLMYDQPLNAIYEQALLIDGTSRRGAVVVTPAQTGAPAFPAVLSAGTANPAANAWTVDPDFRIARMWQNNVQIERAIAQKYSVAVGFTYSRGSNLPVVTNVNVTNPTGTLQDGRPVYSATRGAATRIEPRFNAIYSTQAIGVSNYRAVTAQVGRRFSGGLQFDVAYTLARSEDTAPVTSTLTVQGDNGRSDPSNLERDKGPNVFDQRHTLIGSLVAQPSVSGAGMGAALLNHNSFGVALLMASGIPVNLRSNRDLNNDTISADRPIGVARNAFRLPARFNVDFRYARRIPLTGSTTVEVTAEVKNLLNQVQWSGATSVVTTDALGTPAVTLPAPGVVEQGTVFQPSGGYEQRQFQLGFRVTF